MGVFNKIQVKRLYWRHKARLVAKEFPHTCRVDCQETFAVVVKRNTIRVLISFDVKLGWILKQADVWEAFLHRVLKEVYMEIPYGSSAEVTKCKVCKLKIVLYG